MEKKQEITEITAITDIDQLLAASVELIIYARSLAASRPMR